MRPRRHPLQPRNWSLGSNLLRFEAIRPYVAGRTVLDLGCATGQHRTDWMHALIAGVASTVVGIDLDPGLASGARALGYDIHVGNAETLRLQRAFDVVHAGELVEHLGNPGALLETARHHLRPDGVLLITTPNPFSMSNFVYRFGWKVRVNEDHVCWFCEDTLRHLLERHKYAAEIRYVGHVSPGLVRKLAARLLRSVLPERLRWNVMLAVAHPNEGGMDTAGQDSRVL